MPESRRLRALLLLALAAALPIAIVSAGGSIWIPFADLTTARVFSEKGSWFGLSNYAHNAFHLWRGDPLLIKLAGWLPLGEDRIGDLDLWGYGILCTLGMAYLLYEIAERKSVELALATAVLAEVSLLELFGADRVILGSLCWWPWLAGVFLRTFRARSREFYALLLMLLFITIRVSRSANQLAPIIGATGVAAAYFFIKCRSTLLSDREERFAFLSLILVCVVPLLLAILTLPDTPPPDYPPNAHVVPDDGVPGTTLPLVGQALPVQTIDRGYFHRLYPRPVWILAVTLLLMAGVHLKGGGKRSALNAALLPALLLTALLLDTAIPESLSQIAPLASLSRIVPGTFLVPIPPIALALAILTIACAAHVLDQQLVLGAVFAALFLIPRLAGGSIEIGRMGALIEDESVRFAAALEERIAGERDSDRAHMISAAVSPSLYLLRKYGAEFLERRNAPETLNFRSAGHLGAMVSASHNGTPDVLRRIFDRQRDTRWSSAMGRQTGDEWLLVRFPEPHRIRGLHLSVGDFPTDFPRGISISYREECAESSASDPAGFLTIVEHADWQGTPHLSDKGLPYFGLQNEVKIIFPHPVEARCFLVRQTATTTIYEWSVAELNVAED